MKRKAEGNAVKRSGKRRVYRDDLIEAMGKFLPRRGLPLQVANNKVRWVPRMLVTAAILMSWDMGGHLKDAFVHVWDCLVAMYPTRRRPGRSSQ